MNLTDTLPLSLVLAIQIYDAAGLKVTDAIKEHESADYEACRFLLNGKPVVFRNAKITPTKLGQFVTIWQRSTKDSPIRPFDCRDDISFIVISIFDKNHRGYFIFDREILLLKNIMSKNGGGKRALRLYPPFSRPESKEALKTQIWQLPYFIAIEPNKTPDYALLRELFKA